MFNLERVKASLEKTELERADIDIFYAALNDIEESIKTAKNFKKIKKKTKRK